MYFIKILDTRTLYNEKNIENQILISKSKKKILKHQSKWNALYCKKNC